MDLTELKRTPYPNLLTMAKGLGVKIDENMQDAEADGASALILAILAAHVRGGGSVKSIGTLEILGDGFGFLRGSSTDFSPSPQDVYVSPSQIRRFHLNTGDTVSGQVRPPKESERYFALLRVETINGRSATKATPSPAAEQTMVPADTLLAVGGDDLESQLFEALCPIGHGQRVLLMAPLQCDATDLLCRIAKGAHQRDSKLAIFSLLLSKRPETIQAKKGTLPGEVTALTFDEAAQRTSQSADAVMEQAKQRADEGKEVLVLVDSLTQLATAASMSSAPNGNLPHGLTPKGLQSCKHLLAFAGNRKSKGSITIVAVLGTPETSALDAFLFRELSPATNCQIYLSTEGESLDLATNLDPSLYHNSDLAALLGKDLAGFKALRKRLARPHTFEVLGAVANEVKTAKSSHAFWSKQ